jgi:2-oxoglutarate ferredoxin oxidoreductase subunit alpha
MPVVIHLAGRPGPATGLPTRTEQGDLELAVSAGHGEFPRVIYAPGNLEDAFWCTRRGFDVADRFQIPVFVLTDQFLLDSYCNIPSLDFPTGVPANHIVPTDKNYKRYQITADGISPRGIPGQGSGLVCVDSDEHDEGGSITEDPRIRALMVEKRLRKGSALQEEALAPEFYGSGPLKKLVIGWGSTYPVIREALRRKNESGTGFLYFKQVYPLPRGISDYLKRSREIVIVENNATGQFAKLIKRETGFSAFRQVLKYDGLPFSVEELIEAV